MAKRAKDPFFTTIGKYLGVPPGEIQLSQSKIPGEFTCIGPLPKPPTHIPRLPNIRNYCFTFVLKIAPPRALCKAYRQEYKDLKAQLPALIEAGAWDDVAAIAERLSELETAIKSACRVRERLIRYCIFPDEWIDDPFARDRTRR